MTTPPKKGGRFQPGVSGNVKGRPRGSGEIGKLRASIAAHLPKIIKSLVARAIDGDPASAKILIDRCIPVLKPVETSVSIPVSGSLTEQGTAIFAAIANGTITAEQGRSLLTGLDTLARLRESDEFERRLARLEGAQDDA